ncbi:SRPBCC family protein [Streptomyces sp. ISL-10]|uniref:SRPBCC family protein n=1 Tax=Streptomyces sp. ISL-10 TaxID=2819172 RepID=UPI001BEB9943|nr:SRPBCC family protein [Streptomyces sp. ISL-10]MBT2365660.1 SRPBCC family protein [Streptomyces sp. ISL-10]
MTGSGRTGVAGDAGTRLKEELQRYLEARAEKAVTGLGERLGEATRQLGDPGNSLGSALGMLSKGGQALGEGKSPRGAAVSAALSHLAGGVKDQVSGLLGKVGKGGGKGETRGKSVVIVEDVDVGVPVRQTYDQWTQFQQFSRFSKGVVNVEQSDETTTNWQVKVAKANRSWKAKIVEQIPDERIVWTSEGAKGTTKGVVTFHPLGDNLTKVLLVLEYFPKGLVEKTGNLVRAQGRRARLDLKLFRKFVTFQDEPAEGWRGEIRDGEVVRGGDEGEEEDEKVRDRREAEEGEEAEGDWADEDEDDEGAAEEHEPHDRRDPYDTDEDRAYEDEEEPYEEPHEDERPSRRAAARR